MPDKSRGKVSSTVSPGSHACILSDSSVQTETEKKGKGEKVRHGGQTQALRPILGAVVVKIVTYN